MPSTSHAGPAAGKLNVCFSAESYGVSYQQERKQAQAPGGERGNALNIRPPGALPVLVMVQVLLAVTGGVESVTLASKSAELPQSRAGDAPVVVSRIKPGGSDPAIEYVYGAVPPVATTAEV